MTQSMARRTLPLLPELLLMGRCIKEFYGYRTEELRTPTLVDEMVGWVLDVIFIPIEWVAEKITAGRAVALFYLDLIFRNSLVALSHSFSHPS